MLLSAVSAVFTSLFFLCICVIDYEKTDQFLQIVNGELNQTKVKIVDCMYFKFAF